MITQANEQLIIDFDLQRFADDVAAAQAETQPEVTQEQTEQTAESAQAETQPQTATDEQIDYSKLGDMSPEEQISYLNKYGVFDDGVKEEKSKEAETKEEPKQEQQAIPSVYDLVINGEKQQVDHDQVIALAQQGWDYSRKTRELADERRKLDAMIAALQAQQITQGQPPQEQPNPIAQEYEAAVAAAERMLGIKPGEFNPYDPQHGFVLNRVQAQANAAQMARQQVGDEVKGFLAEAQKDPLAKEIFANYDQYIMRLGGSSPEGARKAQALAMARGRLDSGQLTKEDIPLLKEHWAYVRSEIAKTKEPPKPPKPAPPKTEAPGQGTAKNTPGATIDYAKLRSLSGNTDRQIEYLRSLGYLKE